MSVLIIGEAERKLIAAAIERAAARPVLWEQVKDAALSNPGPELKLADRKPGVERPASEHLMLGNIRVAYSHEQQPAGFVRHISMSIRRKGMVPDPIAAAIICKEFGFSRAAGKVLLNEPDPGPRAKLVRVWLEEFDPGHHAVNVIELIHEPKAGTA